MPIDVGRRLDAAFLANQNDFGGLLGTAVV